MSLLKLSRNKIAKENDPDTLQILDESDRDWVKLWKAKLEPTKPRSHNEPISIAITTISSR
jgi:hypothetical protein